MDASTVAPSTTGERPRDRRASHRALLDAVELAPLRLVQDVDRVVFPGDGSMGARAAKNGHGKPLEKGKRELAAFGHRGGIYRNLLPCRAMSKLARIGSLV